MECKYFPSMETKKHTDKLANPENWPSCRDSESNPVFNIANVDASQQQTLVLFSSSSSPPSESESLPDRVSSLHFNQQMLIDSLAPPSYVPEPQLITPPFHMSFTGVSPACFREDLIRGSLSNPPACITPDVIHIATPPMATRSHHVQFFLKYHRETINESHYFLYYDYTKLCTKILFAIAENCDALRHGMVAFSALIYSVKVDSSAREKAFLYYSVSLQQLRLLLEDNLMEFQCQAAAVTALQLATFDVFPFPACC